MAMICPDFASRYDVFGLVRIGSNSTFSCDAAFLRDMLSSWLNAGRAVGHPGNATIRTDAHETVDA